MTMSDDDLVRRGDVLAAVLDAMRKHVYPRYTEAIAALPAVTPRPMKDAPRDGTKVLAWWPSGPGWKTTWSFNDGAGDGWQSCWAWCYADALEAPTRFLPHPPEGGSDE
jgi:hypothetical protein